LPEIVAFTGSEAESPNAEAAVIVSFPLVLDTFTERFSFDATILSRLIDSKISLDDAFTVTGADGAGMIAA
jgi:hypothetical protein